MAVRVAGAVRMRMGMIVRVIVEMMRMILRGKARMVAVVQIVVRFHFRQSRLF